MNTRQMIRACAAAGVVAVMMFGSTASSLAADTTPTPSASPTPAPRTEDLSALKQKCINAIDERLTFIQKLVTRINAAGDLTASDKAQLLATATGDTSGLTNLKPAIENATTLSVVRADCRLIVVDYRVYMLYGPQVHLTIASDRINALVPKLQALVGKVQTLVNQSNLSDSQRAKADATLNDISTKLNTALVDSNGISPKVLALTPPLDGSTGFVTTLKAASQSLQNAREALEGVRTDLQIMIELLSGGGTPSPSPTA